MPNPEIEIKTITKSSIKLDPLATFDRTKDGEFEEKVVFDVDSKKVGYKKPFITINGIRVDTRLISFELDTNGFLPVCSFSFLMSDSVFLSKGYPKDGDVFSVYIRAVGEVYKPIRMDFNVLSVDGVPISGLENSDGIDQTFTILGECRVPGIYTQRTKAFRNKTSAETLIEVSQDLGLGFSTNDISLNDSMTWICPNFSYYDFVMEVCQHAYKDDFSYYDVWVDVYYNLNFVNLGNQFGIRKMEAENVRALSSGRGGNLDDDSIIPGMNLGFLDVPLILNNRDENRSLSLFIEGYTLLSNSGQNANMGGYFAEVQYYNSNKEEDGGYGRYLVESITTSDIGENTFIQKGRPTEDLYRDEKRIVWTGSNKTGDRATTHANYNHSEIQNEINLLDSMKFNLVLEFSKYLPFLYRGQVVPVEIYVKDQGKRKENSGDGPSTSDGKPVLDKFLSGLYVISGYELFYDREESTMRHRLNLRKKTWTLNSSGDLPNYYPLDSGVGDLL